MKKQTKNAKKCDGGKCTKNRQPDEKNARRQEEPENCR